MTVTSRPQWLALCLVVAGTIVLPVGLPLLNAFLPTAHVQPSFIPSIDPPRERKPIDAAALGRMRGAQPDYVVIGDSMAGSRIAPSHLSKIVGGRGAASLLYPGSGPVYWFLCFKNLVVGTSRGGTKAAIFFFRDVQLTDPMMRLRPRVLDTVALDYEPEVDRVVAANTHGGFYQVHQVAQRIYDHDRTRDWLEPLVTEAPVALVAPKPSRKRLLDAFNKELFSLDALRRMETADIPEISDELMDFDARLPLSLLPDIIRISKASGIRVAFIRVQRRPTADGPPPQSPQLLRYLAKLQRYLHENGAYYHDDYGDPDQPLSVYGDGDHLSRAFRLRYTELFVQKNPGLFR